MSDPNSPWTYYHHPEKKLPPMARLVILLFLVVTSWAVVGLVIGILRSTIS